jgi:hypothetical protein
LPVGEFGGDERIAAAEIANERTGEGKGSLLIQILGKRKRTRRDTVPDEKF